MKIFFPRDQHRTRIVQAISITSYTKNREKRLGKTDIKQFLTPVTLKRGKIRLGDARENVEKSNFSCRKQK